MQNAKIPNKPPRQNILQITQNKNPPLANNPDNSFHNLTLKQRNNIMEGLSIIAKQQMLLNNADYLPNDLKDAIQENSIKQLEKVFEDNGLNKHSADGQRFMKAVHKDIKSHKERNHSGASSSGNTGNSASSQMQPQIAAQPPPASQPQTQTKMPKLAPQVKIEPVVLPLKSPVTLPPPPKLVTAEVKKADYTIESLLSVKNYQENKINKENLEILRRNMKDEVTQFNNMKLLSGSNDENVVHPETNQIRTIENNFGPRKNFNHLNCNVNIPMPALIPPEAQVKQEVIEGQMGANSLPPSLISAANNMDAGIYNIDNQFTLTPEKIQQAYLPFLKQTKQIHNLKKEIKQKQEETKAKIIRLNKNGTRNFRYATKEEKLAEKIRKNNEKIAKKLLQEEEKQKREAEKDRLKKEKEEQRLLRLAEKEQKETEKREQIEARKLEREKRKEENERILKEQKEMRAEERERRKQEKLKQLEEAKEQPRKKAGRKKKKFEEDDSDYLVRYAKGPSGGRDIG